MERCDLKELEKDFDEALSCIDFRKYDPYSRPFMKALFIGQMYMAAKCMDGEEDDVEEELDGARKYMETYLETGEMPYRDMAKDELRHAGILIKEHYKHADGKMREMLEEHENVRQELMKRLGKEE